MRTTFASLPSIVSLVMVAHLLQAADTNSPDTHVVAPPPTLRATNASELYILGCKLLNGEGVPTDKAKAVELLRKAAEMGHTKAQRQLGSHYLIARDFNEATKWTRRAAE